MIRKARAAGMVLLLAVWWLAPAAPSAADGHEGSTLTYGAYELRFVEDLESRMVVRLEVTHEGDQVAAFDPFDSVAGAGGVAPNLEVPLGTDVNGDGVPDAVLEAFSGGAHCCFRTLILSLGDELKVLVDLETRDSSILLSDVDGDPALELTFADMTFAYWKTSFAQSPAPPVVFDFQDGRYVPSPRLMRRAGDSVVYNMSGVAKDIREDGIKDSNGDLNPEVWSVMLELIYSGNGGRALKFLDMVWTDEAGSKADFRSEFRTQLMTSPYWPSVAKLNGWDSAKPF